MYNKSPMTLSAPKAELAHRCETLRVHTQEEEAISSPLEAGTTNQHKILRGQGWAH